MGKTERALLDALRASPHGQYGVISGYRKGRKNGWYGRRSTNAVHALVAAGLVEVVSTTRHNEPKEEWVETIIRLCEPAATQNG